MLRSALTLASLAFGPVVMAQTSTSQLSPAQLDQMKTLSPTQIEQLKQMPSEDVEKLKLDLLKTGSTPQTPPPVVTPTPTPAAPSSAAEKEAKSVTEKAKLTEPVEEKSIKQALKLFGYDLFQGAPSTFAPVSEIPVTSDYVLGPGDTVIVNTYGARNDQLTMVVSREGQINYPGIGPIIVAGQTYEEMSVMLLQRIEKQLIGVKATITMGPLRSIRVFILGEATRPGAYTVSSMSTITNALFVSGGVKTIGSLRKILLRRQGKTIAKLDLYDLLMKGDTGNDARLLPGDVIFIPKIGETVGVAGDVLRPAIYELNGEKTVEDLVNIAGGLLPTAYPQATQVERIDDRRQKTIVDADLTPGKVKKVAVQDGDLIRVYSILDRMDKIVLLSGHVHRPGGVQWHQNMRLTDLISGFDDLLPRPEMNFLIVKRETLPDRHIVLLRANLAEALKNPGGAANLQLLGRDEVFVFGQDGNRTKALAPLIEQLKRQARSGTPELVVNIEGSVIAPGQYPMTAGMRINDLLVLAGKLREDADLKFAIIAREVMPDRHLELLRADLAELLKNPQGAANLQLQPHDEVFILGLKEDRSKTLAPLVERLKRQALTGLPTLVVNVSGSVFSPGQYPLTAGMRISDLLLLAGNMSEGAYRLDGELVRYNVDSKNARTTELKKINLAAILTGDKGQDIELQPFDNLLIKAKPGWSEKASIEIDGNVRFPGRYQVARGEMLSSVIRRAGGFLDTAAPEAAVFLRERLRVREQEAIDRLAERLQLEMATASLRGTNAAAQGYTTAGQQSGVNVASQTAMYDSMVKTLKSTKAIGRLAIELQKIAAETGNGRLSEFDVTVEDGDKLFVPALQESVTVAGEVNYPSSHLYQYGLGVDDYLNRAGRATQNADESRIYVIHANGSVQPAGKSWWPSVGGSSLVKPGDTIVVPVDVRQVAPITMWSSISQIFMNTAVAAAAFKTIGIVK